MPLSENTERKVKEKEMRGLLAVYREEHERKVARFDIDGWLLDEISYPLPDDSYQRFWPQEIRRHRPQETETERIFRNLAAKWREETKALSSITAKSIHPCYQAIIAMGPDVIPFIFKELKKDPDDWFWALRYLCNANPVAIEDHGDIEKMTEAWLSWARVHNYL